MGNSWLWFLVVIAVAAMVMFVLRGRPRSALGTGLAETPDLDSCLKLARQYLDKGRLMEAMVVCKKGIKGAPSDPLGRIMLARVYLAQRKHGRAAAVLHDILTAHPEHKEAVALLREIEGSNTERRES